MKINWQTLYESDSGLAQITSNEALIANGLGPLMADKKTSMMLKKANLLEQSKYFNWQKKAHQLHDCFAEQGIKFLFMKGLAFTHQLYNDQHIRPYSDIDVFIDQDDYDQASDLLLSMGFECYASRQGRFVSFQNSFFDQNMPQTVIDLHWQINNRIEFHQHYPFSVLYDQAITINTGQMSFKTLSHVDAFILGCFHYHAHRKEDRKHIWLYDLALLWDVMNDDVRHNCLEKAGKTEQLTIVYSSLQLLNDNFKGCLNIDAMNIEHSISNQRTEATADYLHKRKNKITDIHIRLNNIKGFKNKLIFISEYLFPSKKYVQRRYHLNSLRWIFLYYPRMWFSDIFKLFR